MDHVSTISERLLAALVQQLYNAQNSSNVEDLVREGVNFELSHLDILSSHISKTMPPIEVSQFTDTTSARIAPRKNKSKKNSTKSKIKGTGKGVHSSSRKTGYRSSVPVAFDVSLNGEVTAWLQELISEEQFQSLRDNSHSEKEYGNDNIIASRLHPCEVGAAAVQELVETKFTEAE